MHCLCCGKPLNNAKDIELKSHWHERCIKSFFGSTKLPELDLSIEQIKKLADESISQNKTVTGVQRKLYIGFSSNDDKRLTIVNYPSGYILKPQSEEYAELSELEYVSMLLAKACKIKTVPFGLLKLSDGSLAYITKRIDRINTEGSCEKLAMEDFCQLSERLTEDKYKGSYEKCAKVIDSFSSQTGLDLSEFYLRVVFSYIIGNSDMHLKNFSLIEKVVASSEYMLSDAYDLLPVKLAIPEDAEDMALTLNGKKNNFKREDFLSLAKSCDINEKAANKMIDAIVSKQEEFKRIITESELSIEAKFKFIKLIETHIERIS